MQSYKTYVHSIFEIPVVQIRRCCVPVGSDPSRRTGMCNLWEFPFEADGMICIGVRNPHNYHTADPEVCQEFATEIDVRPLRPVNPYIDKIFRYQHGEKTYVISLMTEPVRGYRPLCPGLAPGAKPPTRSGILSRVA